MATLVVITQINELIKMKLMRKYSIGAFPNIMTMMFNDLSDLGVMNVVYNAMNQDENNNQTQMLMMIMMNNNIDSKGNFSKYFDVLLKSRNNVLMTIVVNEQKNKMGGNGHDDKEEEEEKFMAVILQSLMDIKDELLEYIVSIDDEKDNNSVKIVVDAAVAAAKQQSTWVYMNIPLLKFGHILPIVRCLIIDDGAVASVTYDDNNDNIIYLMIKQKMMAILNINLNDNLMMMKIIHNSNNKKLTNNCKIEINTDNINFSYYCDDDKYYEIIFNNVSVFLSQKEVDIMQINGSKIIIMIMMMMENKLQSHIQSFIVTDVDDEKNMIMQMITKSSITSQSNTNKSDYAFEKTLNNIKINIDDDDDESSSGSCNDKFYVAICNDKKNISIKSMTMMMMPMTESTSKLSFSFLPPSHHNFFSFSMQLNPMMMMLMKNKSITTSNDENDDDAGYLIMMISDKMQLNCQKSLQSYKESEQQSGIVVEKIKIIIRGATNHKDVKQEKQKNIILETVVQQEAKEEEAAAKVSMEHAAADDNNDRMNINELLFSHINDKNETLIDNTVNITCDFNYLNYKINNDKINDQNRKDSEEVKVNVKDSNLTTLCNNNNNNYNYNNDNNYNDKPCESSNDNAPKFTTSYFTTTHTVDELIECQRREKALMNQFETTRRSLRLCGGGGDSLSGAGASGWGSPPSNPNAVNPNNQNAGNWGASAQQQAPQQQQTWNQGAQQSAGGPPAAQQIPNQAQQAAVGQQQSQGNAPKPLTPSSTGGWGNPNQPPLQIPNQAQAPVPQQPLQQVPPSVVGGVVPPGIVGGGTSTVAAKNQLEQLNSMREALFSQDGWSCSNVNQDTNWDVPGSPEPGPRDSAAPGVTPWKSHQINNGTELWEANLRNGGQPPPQPVQKTPWNHTPSTNIGGTWGEEDEDSGENSSVWTSNQNTQPPAPTWNQPNSANSANSGANAANVWPAAQGN